MITLQRPEHFRVYYQSSLANGLGYAFIGSDPSSSLAVDRSGYNNNGTCDVTSWQFANGRWGVNHAGGNCILVPYALQMYPASTFSFACWIKSLLTDYSSNPYIIGQYETGGDKRQWALRVLATTDKFDIVCSAAGTATTVNAETSQSVQLGWHHVAANVSFTTSTANSYWDFYYDGKFVETVTVIDGFGNRGSNFSCGGTGGGTASFSGGQQDVLYYPNRHLSDAEIAALADPSNVMLSGLILPPRRRLFNIGAAAPPSTKIPIIMHHRRMIGAA